MQWCLAGAHHLQHPGIQSALKTHPAGCFALLSCSTAGRMGRNCKLFLPCLYIGGNIKFPCENNMLPRSSQGRVFSPLLWHRALAWSFAQAFSTANGLLAAFNWEPFELDTLLELLSCGFDLESTGAPGDAKKLLLSLCCFLLLELSHPMKCLPLVVGFGAINPDNSWNEAELGLKWGGCTVVFESSWSWQVVAVRSVYLFPVWQCLFAFHCVHWSQWEMPLQGTALYMQQKLPDEQEGTAHAGAAGG